jgi:hypothetical protein
MVIHAAPVAQHTSLPWAPGAQSHQPQAKSDGGSMSPRESSAGPFMFHMAVGMEWVARQRTTAGDILAPPPAALPSREFCSTVLAR